MALQFNGKAHRVAIGGDYIFIPPQAAWIDKDGVVHSLNFVIRGTGGFVDEEMFLQLLPHHTMLSDLAEKSAQILAEHGIGVASDYFYTHQQPGKPLTNQQVIINALVKPPSVDLLKHGVNKTISFAFDNMLPKAYFNARAIHFGDSRPSPVIKGTIKLSQTTLA
jgi:hypothetical protein